MSILYETFARFLFHPTKIVVIDEQKRWKGIEILLASMRLAEVIEQRSGNSRIGIMLPTSGLFPVAAYASWMLGRTVVPLNYLLKPDDLQHICDDSGIDMVITVSPMLDFLKERPHGVKFILMDKIDFRTFPAVRWPAFNYRDDLAVLLYTSGTSGRPKGVMLSHGNIEANINQCCDWAEFKISDSMLGVLPQFHVFGMTVLTFLPLSRGMLVHYLSRFQPQRIVQWMGKFKPTIFIAIPTMFNALLRVKNAGIDDFASLKYIISGGEPLPESVALQYRERFGVFINEGYGLTETSAVTHWCRPWEFRPKSAGRALPDIEVRIVALDEERVVATGEDGEIRMRGPNIMQGYYHLPEDTDRAFDEEGYFRTGDIGHVDEDGFLYITGRLKEMMIIGGENVFPRDIEEVLNQHEAVHDSAVIGVRDPSRGEVPIAFVELSGEGVSADENVESELRGFCRLSLPTYKVPREIYVVEELPRNATGKIMRRALVDPKGDRGRV